ncbi:MAG: HlyD family secretion protein [Verrucomicrobia bacterium]|nr:HlyD family secretion protein [Verrucomicrobiota bacterium]
MPEEVPPTALPTPPAAPRSPSKWAATFAAIKRRPRLALVTIGALLVVFVVLPRLARAWHSVSTDDAYVNGYVTFAAPRVGGQVARVLVEDNNRVSKGDALVELDPEPYDVQVAIKQAAVDAAKANLVVAQATVRGQIGQTRGLRFKLQHAIEGVDDQTAVIKARVATWERAKATQVYAQAEFDRARQLLATKVWTQQDYDQRREQLDGANADVKQALENVHEARAALGLPAQPTSGNLAEFPADLDQTFSSVRQALAELLQSAAQLGVVPTSYDFTPKQILEEFYRRDPGGDVNKIYAEIIRTAPALKDAEAKLIQTERDLDEAKLNRRYCTVVAEIDGVITRRNVNPGNNVQPGQTLMAIRSLRDTWIDANFKETQLRNLRIGQRVLIEADMYSGRRTFEGRISGFTFGTGSTLALLPPQNATGNFVKVVQRLPVRIELVNYDPDKLPLFIGLSVTPTVDLESEPTGPNAGQFLQALISASPASPSATAETQ